MIPKTAAILLAAGSGSRFGHPCAKVFHHLDGKPVWQHSAEALRLAGLDTVLLVVSASDRDLLPETLPVWMSIIEGGETRGDSVRAGLAALSPEYTHVLVHDAARPLRALDVILRLHQALEQTADVTGAVPALPIADTLKYSSNGLMVERTVDRTGLYQIQTPQLFRASALRAAHTGAPDATDDAALIEKQGGKIVLVTGDPLLHKITWPSDAPRLTTPRTRYGQGFDVHAFKAGTSLMLGGVEIPCGLALEGHSDADVLLHAVTDAILGAIGAADIGHHFPPTNPQWRGAPSAQFVSHALRLAAANGWQVYHADVTIIGETPKIAPHREAIQQSLARLLCLSAIDVTIKATTTEKLGFLGRREGLAALALVGVMKQPLPY